ncbi:MAG: YggS family pyridoxal phosphate-dependent enzyme [Chitinophagales bacterium]|nr:YggS family pyridoxal phosphate-dependent enzyme [Chitinophagales bacterium]
MPVNTEAYQKIISQLNNEATLVAVSKIKPVEDILALYQLGQKDFGENYVQELVDKQAKLPSDIRWHFIGHLQSNKVKYIAPFVHLIHGVDSLKLLKEINKQAIKYNRIIHCLLQVHIAQETTKFGFSFDELQELNIPKEFINISVDGLMGMASFSDDRALIRNEFKQLKNLFDKLKINHPQFHTLSIGMSDDYTIALEEGSNMIRIGSLLFGKRIY